MSCTRPLDGYRATSGRVIVVERGTRPPRDATTRIPMQLPCQKCIGCRMEYSRQWGLRCLHEAKMWPCSSYVTLTYNDEFVPPGYSLCLRDVQLFMKRLRKAREPDKIRFFLGGEYGDGNKRPHYHALLFNCGFRDLRKFGDNKRGEPLYTSAELSSLWSVDGKSMGFCTVGAVTYDSAIYCAKYALKKVDGAKREAGHYEVYDADGQVFERSPEFAIMSRRPGIGAGYCDKFGSSIVAHDSVIVGGRPVKPPRYYKQRLAVENEDAMVVHRRKGKLAAVRNAADNTQERLRVKERLMEIAALKKARTL